ncbi:MAG TPA: hypothetical protein VFG14_14715 [Chthoniobacteraceae bacterium]|nr:hypothetical protein [Chthoniobacteraceae bacterium]
MKKLSLLCVVVAATVLSGCETDRVVEHRTYSYSEPNRYGRVYYREPARRAYYRQPVRRAYHRDYYDDYYDSDRVALRYSGAPASPAAVNLGF